MKQNYNNESLARLGHGKWKSALGHTLLIIGMVLMSLGVYAQQMTPVPDGLKMEKKWVSNDPTGRTGNIYVETFVTGHSVSTHVPTDIVLVLDVSGSMDEHLYDARESQGYSYNSYGDNEYYILYEGSYYLVQRGTSGNGGNRRYYLYFEVEDSSGWWPQTYTYYLSGTTITEQRPNNQSQTATIWTGVLYEQGQTKMEALQTSVGLFVDIIAADATQYNVDHRISIVKYAMAEYYNSESFIEEGDHEFVWSQQGYQTVNDANYTEVVINRRDPRTDAAYIKDQVDGLHASGATAADYGMSKARYLLASIPASQFEERNKVVVMFTDGSPTHGSSFDNEVATSTISNAYNLKHSWTYNNNTYQFDATVFSVGVFDNETTQINTYMNYTSSNYPNATSMTSGGTGSQENGYYFKAESAGGLSEIFETIAGQSGAMSLPAATIVQDMVSPNFQLPAGATGTITAYAPLCTGYNAETGVYTFQDINDAGTLSIGSITTGDGETITGVVTGGTENKLPANFVTIGDDNKTIQMKGFNFSYHWCGYQDNVIHGRKIVIKIPVEVKEGTWGDGIQTNDPEHSYVQVGDVYYGPFNNLTTNVLGDVWTEIVTSQPEGYNDTIIDSPEDLAWFISRVNGRIHYNGETNNVASNTTLNGKLKADIDMSAHNWVPIGAGYKCNANNEFILDANGKKIKLAYEGEFDGNGHVITGLKNNADKWYKTASGQENEVVVYPGMFSNVKGTVHDVFILDSDFRGKAHQVNGKGKFIHHGILADTLTGGSIYNCEAAGRMTCNDDNDNDVNLIYGGLVGLIMDNGTVHSSMAMAKLTGYTMGGAVGENRNGSSFKNGFTNGEYHYLVRNGVSAKPVGGLAAINAGTIDNCYVRFERYNENLDKATFNQLVADGDEATNCYIQQLVTWSRPNYNSYTTEVNLNRTVPTDILHPAGYDANSNSYTLSVNPTFYNMFVNDNMTGGTWGTFTNSQGTFNVYNNGTPLLDKLNANKGTGASWKRTTAGNYSEGAGNINGDFPVLQLPGYTCLASTDGITIDYASSLDELLERHNNYTVNTNSTWNNNKYKNTRIDAIKGGTINLYQNDSIVTKSTVSGSKDGVSTVVYIDENISLLQDANSTIDAYTAQTLESYIPSGKERWHYVSSSLENSQFGWTYGEDGDVGHTWAEDPCEIALEQVDEDHALFPIDLISYKRFDFYCFYEPKYHWINFKRNSASHYHMDAWDSNTHITYDNETQFKKGKGYLMSIDMSTWASYNRDAQFIQNRGTLTNGAFTIPVTYTPINDLDGYKTGLEGCNLLGNPYQSYLDFDDFTTANSGLWSEGDTYGKTYAIYDPKTDNYIQYLGGSSKGALVADRFINMHQGFLIKVSNGGNAIFNNDMRTNNPGKNYPGFRGEKPAYPLINFILNDNDGNTDIAVLECNRPENDGAKKLRVGNPAGRIYFRYDNTNMAIFFRDNAEGHQTLNFAAEEDGNFTLNWNTANADFRSLTLVDNITGIKTDMLTHDHYTFEGRVDDYNTRFKIVFGEMNNNEEEPVLEHFAFFDHGNLIVNGTGHFEVVDVLGRVVYATELTDTQNTVSLPSNVRGVCMLCFTRNNETKVQKMVIQ